MSSPGATPGPADDRSGQVLAGRYELGHLLGTGGMAEVYAAVDRRLGRTVAVKVLRPDLARDETVRARFRREAQSAASLNHPTVVAVHDTGDDTGEPFIVMEYVAGHTLREVMHRGQPMPVDQALEITIGVLTALELAHRAGIVHRDIKPGNVMITPDGAVKVMDFGIARALSDDLTLTQTVVGTPAYLSPEHAEGKPVDVRSDLYSTGCVLFELLTGRPPFVAESAYVVAVQHIQEAPPVPSSLNPALPPVLDQIVAKALAKDREARYQTAAQLRADLERVRGAGRPTASAPTGSGDAREEPTDPIVLESTARMPMPAPVAAPGPAAVPGAPPALSPTAALPSAAEPAGAPPTPPRGFRPPAPAAVPGALAAGPAEKPSEPGTSRRHRWPWVAAAAAALLVVGGVVLVVVRGDGTPTPGATPVLHDVADLSTVEPPSATDLRDSVAQLSPEGLVTVLDTRDRVKVLDLAGSITPWVEPEKKGSDTVVPLSTDLLFDYGSSQISDGGKEAVLDAVTSVPHGASIAVTGYTDSKGNDADNIALSQARADAVAAIIRDERPDLDVSSVGKGSADPVAQNTNADGTDNPDGRSKNRRVEIRYAS